MRKWSWILTWGQTASPFGMAWQGIALYGDARTGARALFYIFPPLSSINRCNCSDNMNPSTQHSDAFKKPHHSMWTHTHTLAYIRSKRAHFAYALKIEQKDTARETNEEEGIDVKKATTTTAAAAVTHSSTARSDWQKVKRPRAKREYK